MLNRAFAADPDAVHAMVCNRVPCNNALADDPTVVVSAGLVAGSGPTVGMMGLLNGLLGEIGIPLVVTKFDEEPDADGRHKMLGFCEYVEPKEAEDGRSEGGRARQEPKVGRRDGESTAG